MNTIKWKTQLILLLICSLAWLIESSAAPTCKEHLSHKPTAMELRDLLDSADNFMKGKQVDTDGLFAESYLGHGVSGHVLKVNRNGTRYALKILKSESNNEDPTGLIIQDTLAQMGWAPELIGIIPADQLSQWLRRQDFQGQQYVHFRKDQPQSFGVLMALNSRFSFKHPRPNSLQTSQEIHDRLLKQADAMGKVFKQLEVYPYDMDAVLDPKNNLSLIDLTWFRPFEALDRSVLKTSVQDIIEKLKFNIKASIVIKD